MSAARCDMLPRIFCFEIVARALEGHGPLRAFDVLEHRLNVLVGELGDVVEDEHQAADFFDQVGVFLREVLEQRRARWRDR